PTSYGRLPTYNFRPMTCTPLSQCDGPIAPIGVGWMSSRNQAELQEERVTKARYAGGRQVRGKSICTVARRPTHTGRRRAMYHNRIGFSNALCLSGGTGPFLAPLPPHIQLSYETNPVQKGLALRLPSSHREWGHLTPTST